MEWTLDVGELLQRFRGTSIYRIEMPKTEFILNSELAVSSYKSGLRVEFQRSIDVLNQPQAKKKWIQDSRKLF